MERLTLSALLSTLHLSRKFKSVLNFASYEQFCLLCTSIKLDSNPEHSDFCADCIQQFPRNLLSCQRCAIPLENTYHSNLICGNCQQHPPSFDSVIASFRYEYPLNKLITAFKYKQRLELIPALAREMQKDISTVYNYANIASAQPPDALIPIPLHRLREFKRGYNQSTLLAQHLSTAFDIPLLEDSLIRHKHTATQATLDKEQRQMNLRNAFTFKQPAKLPLKHIVLCDDVMTTGSTVEAASRACRQAGVERIDVWCCARAEI